MENNMNVNKGQFAGQQNRGAQMPQVNNVPATQAAQAASGNKYINGKNIAIAGGTLLGATLLGFAIKKIVDKVKAKKAEKNNAEAQEAAAAEPAK